ncbi:MAG: hypothetical protein H6719_33875 [Sandaracinaceae bacterium]|nr:hypothetical protein [Sandaracinaceae bacterium]
MAEAEAPVQDAEAPDDGGAEALDGAAEEPPAASALTAPPAEPQESGEFAELDDEAPPGQPSPSAIREARNETPPPPAAEPEPTRPRFWRMPRADTQRPQTLPQGVMFWRSTISVAVVPAGTSGQFRASGFFGYAVGVFDDLEIGTNPVGVTFAPPFSGQDPSFFLRARLVSGEVQFSLRGEWTIPASSTASAWMGYSAELAWNPIPWFRFEAAIEYGLHFTQPLQQTIFVPLRAILQAGPNSFGLTTGVVMYNDADAFEVPLYLRYAVAFGGHQGPLSEPALEGGIADLGNAGNAWFFRGVWTFYAYP